MPVMRKVERTIEDGRRVGQAGSTCKVHTENMTPTQLKALALSIGNIIKIDFGNVFMINDTFDSHEQGFSDYARPNNKFLEDCRWWGY